MCIYIYICMCIYIYICMYIYIYVYIYTYIPEKRGRKPGMSLNGDRIVESMGGIVAEEPAWWGCVGCRVEAVERGKECVGRGRGGRKCGKGKERWRESGRMNGGFFEGADRVSKSSEGERRCWRQGRVHNTWHQRVENGDCLIKIIDFIDFP